MGTIGNPTKTVTVGDLIDFGVGSGTPLYLPMWTSDGNLTDSNFYQTSTGNIKTDDATLLGFGKDAGRSNTRLNITTLKDGTTENPPGVALVVEELTAGVSKDETNVLMAMSMQEGNGYFYVRNGDEKGKFTFYGWDGSSFDKYLTIENTGKLNMESHQITSVADPTGAQDAATKAYVDAQFTGNVDGSGTAGFIPKWSDTDTITDSIIQESGTVVSIGGSIKIGDDTAAASASKVGTFRYRTTQSGSDYESLCEMCMQTGASTYAWVAIVSYTWQNM